MSVDKRKHSALSSLSDLETSNLSSTNSPDKTNSTTTEKKVKKNKKKNKKAKVEQTNSTEDLQTKSKSTPENTPENMPQKICVEEELKKINKKLEQVITKEDNSFLRQIVKDVFIEIKETLLSSFTRQIEVIEGELHDKAVENEQLKSELKTMKKEIEQKSDEISKLEKRNEYDKMKYNESLNDQEQYSRKNNIRISNLPNDKDKQTSEETTNQVLEFVKGKLGIDLTPRDIDISHRLGKFKPSGKPRQVIVKLVRRQTKVDILTERKRLKGSDIYVFEDLTKLNNEVLACTRKKQTDEVERSWSVEGKIFIKWKSDSSIERLKFSDYQKWIDLPWPISNNSRRR